MTICAIDGTLGSGKSYSAVDLAYREYLNGRPIFANFDLAFGRRIRSWLEVVSIRDGLFVWDEAHLDLDSRQFSSMSCTPWLTQTRKLGVDLVYCSQDFGQVDKRLRDLTDVLIRCSAVSSLGRRGTRMLVLALHPAPRLTSDKLVMHSPAIYSMYDTRQLIVPLSGKMPSLDDLLLLEKQSGARL